MDNEDPPPEKTKRLIAPRSKRLRIVRAENGALKLITKPRKRKHDQYNYKDNRTSPESYSRGAVRRGYLLMFIALLFISLAVLGFLYSSDFERLGLVLLVAFMVLIMFAGVNRSGD